MVFRLNENVIFSCSEYLLSIGNMYYENMERYGFISVCGYRPCNTCPFLNINCTTACDVLGDFKIYFNVKFENKDDNT